MYQYFLALQLNKEVCLHQSIFCHCSFPESSVKIYLVYCHTPTPRGCIEISCNIYCKSITQKKTDWSPQRKHDVQWLRKSPQWEETSSRHQLWRVAVCLDGLSSGQCSTHSIPQQTWTCGAWEKTHCAIFVGIGAPWHTSCSGVKQHSPNEGTDGAITMCSWHLQRWQ